MRRIPFWLRATRVKLGPPARVLTKQGRYEGNTRNGHAHASRRTAIPTIRPASECRTRSPVRSRCSACVSGRRSPTSACASRGSRSGVSVTPRLVYAGDENRLAGMPALPVDINPYRGDTYGRPPARRRGEQAVARARTTSSSRRGRAPSSGPFSFRLWIDDKTPPRVRLLTPTARRRAHAVRRRQRVGRRSAIDHRPHRRSARSIRAEARAASACRSRESRVGNAPARRSASRTSRRRRTRRASSGSSRTRRSSGRPSAFASPA